MCGIAAVIGHQSADLVTEMLHAMKHRGPDDTNAVTIDDSCTLGINRLAIMDVADGAQPISARDGRVQVVCNGEIYNSLAIRSALKSSCRFRSNSDVEVIAHLYDRVGPDFLQRIDGMFAVILYDQEKQDFVAARDRFGIKPLYYVREGEQWFFASEAKALCSIGKDVSQVRELPPGWMATKAGPRPWIERPIVQLQSVPRVEMVRALLESSVEKQLQTDPGIKVGVFLSGGLDSSIIAALAARHRPDLIAFTIGVEGSRDLAAARKVTERIGVRLVECSISLSEMMARMSAAVYATESYNSVIASEGVLTMILAEAAAREGVKVVLCGEGADEVFAGYGVFLRKEDAEIAALRRQLLHYIHRTECRRLDRATMAFGVEARVPYLDPSLVDYALNLPSDNLVVQTGGRPIEKWILRQAFYDLLPDEIINRVKVPMDHGSGLLGILDDLAKSIDDVEFEQERQDYPNATISSKATACLHKIWRSHFGHSGGEISDELFGYYPVLHHLLESRNSLTGGTGEEPADLIHPT